MRSGRFLLPSLGLLLISCSQSGPQSEEAAVTGRPTEKYREIELLQPADEAALKIASSCRFFKSEGWAKPIALVSAKELAFKRDGKLVRLRRNSNVQPNALNDGQMFFSGNGYTARTIGLADISSGSFGLNIQANDEDRVLVGRYGVLSCPENR